MKKLIIKLLNKAKEFLLWVWHECKDWKTLVLLAIVCVTVGLPVWAGYLLFILFHWQWAFWVASVCLAFWWLPGAPYFALCVSITLIIKRLYERTVQKRLARRGKTEQPADVAVADGQVTDGQVTDIQAAAETTVKAETEDRPS